MFTFVQRLSSTVRGFPVVMSGKLDIWLASHQMRKSLRRIPVQLCTRQMLVSLAVVWTAVLACWAVTVRV